MNYALLTHLCLFLTVCLGLYSNIAVASTKKAHQHGSAEAHTKTTHPPQNSPTVHTQQQTGTQPPAGKMLPTQQTTPIQQPLPTTQQSHNTQTAGWMAHSSPQPASGHHTGKQTSSSHEHTQSKHSNSTKENCEQTKSGPPLASKKEIVATMASPQPIIAWPTDTAPACDSSMASAQPAPDTQSPFSSTSQATQSDQPTPFQDSQVQDSQASQQAPFSQDAQPTQNTQMSAQPAQEAPSQDIPATQPTPSSLDQQPTSSTTDTPQPPAQDAEQTQADFIQLG